VTSKTDLQKAVDTITSQVGYINVLIANSGIQGPPLQGVTPNSTVSELRSALWATDFDFYTKTYAVNTSAVFFSAIAFLELLDAGNKKGNVDQKSQVIATSSIGGFNRSAWSGFAYGSSKAATTHLMKQLATQFIPYDIRSNILAPGSKSPHPPTPSP